MRTLLKSILFNLGKGLGAFSNWKLWAGDSMFAHIFCIGPFKFGPSSLHFYRISSWLHVSAYHNAAIFVCSLSILGLLLYKRSGSCGLFRLVYLAGSGYSSTSACVQIENQCDPGSKEAMVPLVEI